MAPLLPPGADDLLRDLAAAQDERDQLALFLTAGKAGRLMVTTRRPSVLAGTGARPVKVDAVPPQVAREFLVRDLPPMTREAREDLLKLAGGWPLLLGLINRRLAKDLGQDRDIDAATAEAVRILRRDGPAALDVTDPDSRHQAVAATIGYSLDTLDAADQDRFCQLGIFAEDAEVPLPLITALWQATATHSMDEIHAAALCERLDGLSLVSLEWTGDSKLMVIHDVIRDFARSTIGPERRAALNGMLLDAMARRRLAAKQPGIDHDGSGAAWWEPGIADAYLRGQLIWHLIEAGRRVEAAALACDLRWAGTRLAKSGPAAVAADLALAGTSRAVRMAPAVIRVAHLLGPVQPAEAVVDTLAQPCGG